MIVLSPETLSAALGLLAESAESGTPATPVAGGTDLLVHWPQRPDDADRTYLDLSRLTALEGIEWEPEALVLGARTTFWEVIQDDRVRSEFPLLVEAARQVGAVQIQTRGTWAGNIVNASPAADGVPALMAYGAVVVLESRGAGDERSEVEEIPLSEFYLGYKVMRRRPDQLITRIRIPRRRYSVQIFEKVGSRRQQAIAKAGLAVTRSEEGWRVVAASMSPTVCRCPALEALLEEGTPIAGPEELLPHIRENLTAIDDVRSSAVYRERVFARVFYFALRESHPAFS